MRPGGVLGLVSVAVMTVLERLLGGSRVYEFSRRAIGARREMETMIERVIKPQPDHRVLDFGCGNGRLLAFLPPCDYVGVDSNPSYIDDASERLAGPRARFVCGDLLHLDELDLEPVDHVVSIGVLHHLDDETAETAMTSALKILKPGGRISTMDPCFEPDQPSVARVLMAMDRGRFVRHPADYRRLVERAGGSVQRQQIWSDVYKFPYTHCVQTVTN